MIGRAGKRRRIASFEQHDGTLANGETTYRTDTDWDVLKSLQKVPVTYVGVTGGEVIRGMQMEANATGLITVPSTPRTRAIKPRMRVRIGTSKLNILSVIDRDGDQRELYISVRELADT